MIFLFKWQGASGSEPNVGSTGEPEGPTDHIFFANQVIQNACATQAILSILLNRDDLDLGQELRNFKEFTGDFPPDVSAFFNLVLLNFKGEEVGLVFLLSVRVSIKLSVFGFLIDERLGDFK